MQSIFLWGGTGQGKTLRAVNLAVKDFCMGRKIYGNLHLKKIPYTFVEVEQLIDMVVTQNIDSSPKTLILDEIQTAFDGRSSFSKQNKALSLFVSQCRKRGFNIIYTSQFISGADIRMRALTDKLVRCIAHIDRSDVGLGTYQDPEPYKFTYLTIDPKDPLARPKVKTVKRAVARCFYQFYNTLEVVRPREEYIGGA